MTGWWDALPSWLTELLSGFAFDLGAFLFLSALWSLAHRRPTPAPRWAVAILATIGSLIYEAFFDKNPDGKVTDIAQREVGIIIGVLVHWRVV